jgi:hypothetical protein
LDELPDELVVGPVANTDNPVGTSEGIVAPRDGGERRRHQPAGRAALGGDRQF